MPIKLHFESESSKLNIANLQTEQPEQKVRGFDVEKDILPSDWEGVNIDLKRLRDRLGYYGYRSILTLAKKVNPGFIPSSEELKELRVFIEKEKEDRNFEGFLRLSSVVKMYEPTYEINEEDFTASKNLLAKNRGLSVLNRIDIIILLKELKKDFQVSKEDCVLIKNYLEKCKENNWWSQFSGDALRLNNFFPQFSITQEELDAVKKYELKLRSESLSSSGYIALDSALTLKELDPEFCYDAQTYQKLWVELQTTRKAKNWGNFFVVARCLQTLAPNLLEQSFEKPSPIPTIKKF